MVATGLSMGSPIRIHHYTVNQRIHLACRKTTESSEVLKRKTRKSMKVKQFHLTETCKRFKPYILMVLAQIGYTFLYFFTEASFNKGMSPHIYVTYRNAVASFVICPFAYFLDRKARPKLTWALFLEIFLLSLLGACLTLNMYFASIRYTSPTFAAAVLNTVPAITFVIAVLLRLEFLDIKSAHGKAKVAGTIISLAGATTMTFYKGTALKNQWGAMIHIQGKTIHENWLKGSILVVSSSITWSIWYIIQAGTIKRYPAQLSLTAWMCFIGGAQSAVFAVLLENNSEAWHIGLNINLWNVIYSGVICSGLIIFFQLWCTEEKGPVFITLFSPLSTVFVALLSYFVFGEKLHIGSIFGGLVVIIGLYLLLWGKENGKETAGEYQGHVHFPSRKQQGEIQEK